MLKQALSIALLTAGLIGAGTASAANPLDPSYPTFAATIDFGSAQGSVEVAKNPLTPSYYQWNVATSAGGKSVEIVMNNPLHPNFKRS